MNFEDLLARLDGGLISEAETVNILQRLIDSSLVWSMPQVYQNAAMALIHQGRCHTAA
jgi:hypothetical protein